MPWYGRYQTAWRYHVLRLHRVYTSAMAGAAFDREGRKREPPALLQPPEGVEVPQSDFWEYRWGDEFDSCPGGKPNEAVWDYEYGYMRNDELQFYRKENAECVTKAGHGLLQITSLFHPGGVDNPKAAYALSTAPCQQPHDKWPDYCKRDTQAIHYTSSSLFTRLQATGALEHGQYDARIRIEAEVNSWPAWWAIGQPPKGHHYAWPQNGEIDILEYHASDLFMCAAYTDSDDPDNHERVLWAPSDGKGLASMGKVNVDKEWSSRFHVYSMVWTECCMDFYLDGAHMEHIDLHNDLDNVAKPRNPYAGAGMLPLQMKLDLAVPHDVQTPEKARLSKWPIRMEIDYVRYYVAAPSPPASPPSMPPLLPPLPLPAPPSPSSPPSPRPPPPVPNPPSSPMPLQPPLTHTTSLFESIAADETMSFQTFILCSCIFSVWRWFNRHRTSAASYRSVRVDEGREFRRRKRQASRCSRTELPLNDTAIVMEEAAHGEHAVQFQGHVSFEEDGGGAPDDGNLVGQPLRQVIVF